MPGTSRATRALTFSVGSPVAAVSYDDGSLKPECSTTITTCAPCARTSPTAARTLGTMSRISMRPRSLSRSQIIEPGVVAPITATRTPERVSVVACAYAWLSSGAYAFAARNGNRAWAMARLRYDSP